jgi:hypothetical protein
VHLDLDQLVRGVVGVADRAVGGAAAVRRHLAQSLPKGCCDRRESPKRSGVGLLSQVYVTPPTFVKRFAASRINPHARKQTTDLRTAEVCCWLLCKVLFAYRSN